MVWDEGLCLRFKFFMACFCVDNTTSLRKLNSHCLTLRKEKNYLKLIKY